VRVVIRKSGRCNADGKVGTVYISTAALRQLPSDVTVVNWSHTHAPTKHRIIYTADTTSAANRVDVTVVNWPHTHAPTKHRIIYTADTTSAANRVDVLEVCEISL